MSHLVIGPDDAGQRLDRFLRKVLPQSPLGQIFRGLRRGAIRVNGGRVDGGYRLQPDDAVECGPGFVVANVTPLAPAPAAGSAALQVLYEDAHLLVVGKPAGLALHAGSGVRDHLLGQVQALYGAGSGHTFRVAPAHRLDRDTSGAVVFGLSAAGLRGFTALLRSGDVRKTYLALVHGVAPPAADIDLALVRDADRAAGPRVRPDPAGRAARTRFVRLTLRDGRSLLAVDLLTGRTHQIRAHLAAHGLPVVGDRRYGRADRADRLHLHAWRLQFRHPVGGAPVAVEAPPPAALAPDAPA